jgi:phosphoserine aminotransferase
MAVFTENQNDFRIAVNRAAAPPGPAAGIRHVEDTERKPTMGRKFNFYAGPSTLPVSILERIRDEIVDTQGQGLSMIETSHRGGMYESAHNEAIELLRGLLGVPKDRQILFLAGGATLQFAMVPMNLLGKNGGCDYALSGAWAKKAVADARLLGTVRLAFDGTSTNFASLPKTSAVRVPADSAYLHLTSNETIGGVQWKEFPDCGAVPLVADMSSDIMSRRIPVERFGLIYAGAQKNLGPAGLTVVIIAEELLQRSPKNLPAYLSYRTHSEENSLYNTPPVFAVWVLGLMLKWVREQGGLEAVQRRNEEKAAKIYRAIDSSGGFYRSPIDPPVRSTMNVVFRLPSEELEKKFVGESEKAGMLGLKGHRSVGGCRASLYNGMLLEGAQALAFFMQDFAARNG